MKSVLFYCLVTILFVSSLEANRYRCDYTYIKEADGYLKFQEIPANWQEARLRCALEGSVLASPLTPKLRNAINSVVNTNCPQGIWSGFHSLFSTYYASVEGVPLKDTPHTWTKYEPDNEQDEERCIVLLSNGDLADARCNETLPYVCYKKTEPGMAMNACGSPDNAYQLDKRTGKCYKFHNNARVWSRAYLTCMAEGGHLAIINSDAESQVLRDIYIKGIPNPIGNYGTFIGMLKWNDTQDWRTIHGETIQDAGYARWGPDEPNNPKFQLCGAMFRSGLLDDTQCEDPKTFICEKDPESLMCDHKRKK